MPCLIYTESDHELPPTSKDSIHTAVAPSLPMLNFESAVFRRRMNDFQLSKYGAEDVVLLCSSKFCEYFRHQTLPRIFLS